MNGVQHEGKRGVSATNKSSDGTHVLEHDDNSLFMDAEEQQAAIMRYLVEYVVPMISN